MKVELLLDNKNGNVWNLTQIAADITWKTVRIGAPGSLSFTLIKGGIFQSKDFQYSNGDVVRLKIDDKGIFYGYIFSIDSGKDEAVKITCYDQIRYLMSSDTYVFKNVTASDVVKRIAADFKLKLGSIADTIYKISSMVEDGQKLLDMICKALDLTLINSGRNYFLYDDFGALSLGDVEDFLLAFIIGDNSLMYDYSINTSIDSDTYNRVKLYKDNKDTKKREVYIAQDTANMSKWGILQLYQSVDEDMNDAQIKQMLNTLIAIKNRESKTFQIDALGDIRVRAGCYVPVIISEHGINRPFLVDECAHTIQGQGGYTMKVSLKTI